MSVPHPLHPFLPHRAPLLLLEAVLQADAQGGTALARVDPQAWYADGAGAMPAWFGLELMAQAIAAVRGCHLAAAGGTPRGGFLLGTRSYRCSLPAFPAAVRLEVGVRLVDEDVSGLCVYSCEIRCLGESVATAALKVMQA